MDKADLQKVTKRGITPDRKLRFAQKFACNVSLSEDNFPANFMKIDRETAEKIEGTMKENNNNNNNNNNIEEKHTVE